MHVNVGEKEEEEEKYTDVADFYFLCYILKNVTQYTV